MCGSGIICTVMLPAQVRSSPVVVGREIRAAILFTDMESSTALTQRLGDAKGFEEPVRLYEVRWREEA